MVRIFFIISGLLYMANVGFGQSVSNTYSLGDIPTDLDEVNPGCNEIGITIILPAGPSITVTGVDVRYDFTAIAPYEIGDQRSSTLFPGNTSAPVISGSGKFPGTSNYSFLGETDANGTYPGEHKLNFVFSAYRVSGIGSPKCNTTFNKVDNNSLTITVHYNINPADGSVGIGTDTPNNSALLELQSSQKGFLPPRMTSTLMNAIPSPEEGLMVYCSDCVPAGMYSRVGGIWTTGATGNSGFVIEGELVRQNSFNYREDFVFGRDALPGTTAITDTMMFFDYSLAAFRGGRLQNSNAFGESNIGASSFAFGRNAIASGIGSAAFGSFSQATGDDAFAAGSGASATQYAGAAFGEGTASGYASFAAGSGQASGENSVAMGSNTTASGDFSTAIGTGTLARSWGETVVGTYNIDYSPQNTLAYDAADRLFVVGRGLSSGSRNNALTIMKDGKMGVNVSNPQSTLDVNGSAIVRGSVRVREPGIIELLYFDTFKHPTAGQLSYPTPFSPVILTGGGSTLASRRIELRALGGVDVDGGMDIGGGVDIDGGLIIGGDIRLENDFDFRMEKSIGQTTFEILASEGTGEGSQIAMWNELGDRTIEIDADFGVSKVGRIILDEIEIKGGSDLAEYFDSNEKIERLESGTLVCIDENSEGKIKLCSSARDKKVLGVISGANGINPGMIMGQDGSIANGDFPIALLGRVYVKSNNQNGEIKVGDFLTSSSSNGEAMRVDDFQKAQGAILGKALTKRNPQTGFVLVLVNLQ